MQDFRLKFKMAVDALKSPFLLFTVSFRVGYRRSTFAGCSSNCPDISGSEHVIEKETWRRRRKRSISATMTARTPTTNTKRGVGKRMGERVSLFPMKKAIRSLHAPGHTAVHFRLVFCVDLHLRSSLRSRTYAQVPRNRANIRRGRLLCSANQLAFFSRISIRTNRLTTRGCCTIILE